MRSLITGTGAYAPSKVLDNAYFEKIVETTSEWIVDRTGIKERRQAAPEEATSDMAVAAAQKALEMAKTDAKDVDLIVVGTITGDMPWPSTAAVIQGLLGNKKAFAFDVSAACSGSLYALSIADRYVSTGVAKKALVIGAETLTRIVDWTDRNTCILFGDAAGAMLVEPTDDPKRGIQSIHLHTDGSQWNILHQAGPGSRHPLTPDLLEKRKQYLFMNGREVFKFAVRALQDACHEALAANKLTTSDVDHVIVHQANKRIIDATLERLEVPREKCWMNLERYGNTSAASVPMTLDEDRVARRKVQGGRHDPRLRDRRRHGLGRRRPPLVARGRGDTMSKLAFIFPGQGSQAAGMGRALAEAYPAARRVFDEVDAALGESMSGLCFEGPDEKLKLTANTQPAILTVSSAAAAVLAEKGIVPDVVAGHSLGEYSALVAAGALAPADAAKAVRARGTFMQEAVPAGKGAMAAVLGLEPARVKAICESVEAATGLVCSPANYNDPGQTVIAGDAAAVEKASAELKAAGAKRVLPLPVSAPFHCALMAPVKARLEPVLRAVTWREPRVAVVTNVEAKPNREVSRIVPILLEQVTAPVRWIECVEELARLGVTRFVEVGPGKVLSGLVKRIVKDAVVANVEDPASLDKAIAAVKS